MREKPSINRDTRANQFNWQAIHQRLESVRQAIVEGISPGPAEIKKVLKARAQALAQVPGEDAKAGECIEVIEFQLANERYGIEPSMVREVYPLTDLTLLPCTPDFVLGIINVRGEIVSVIDIKKFFDLPEKGLTDLNKVIILHDGNMMFGILADVIVGVRKVSANEIQALPLTFSGIREAYLTGVTNDRMALLDAAKLLSDNKLVIHETVIG